MHSKYVQDILSAETSGYLDLERLADRMEAAILSRDLDSMRSLLAEERNLTTIVAGLSKQRETMTVELCDTLGCAQPSLQKLAERLPEKERRPLLRGRAELITSAEAARDRNRRNSLLLASSLKLYKELLAMCREAVDTGVYSAPGAPVAQPQPVQAALDLKI